MPEISESARSFEDGSAGRTSVNESSARLLSCADGDCVSAVFLQGVTVPAALAFDNKGGENVCVPQRDGSNLS